MPDFQCTNFTVGSNKQDYQTTNTHVQSHFSQGNKLDGASLDKKFQEKLDRVVKARTANFRVGGDRNDYSTQGQQFVKHDLGNVATDK